MNFDLKKAFRAFLLGGLLFCPSVFAWMPCHILIQAAHQRIRDTHNVISGEDWGELFANYDDFSFSTRVREVQGFVDGASEYFEGRFPRSRNEMSPPFVATSLNENNTLDKFRIMGRLFELGQRLSTIDVEWEGSWGGQRNVENNLPLLVRGPESIGVFLQYLDTQCVMAQANTSTSIRLHNHYGRRFNILGVAGVMCGIAQAWFQGGPDIASAALVGGGLSSLWWGRHAGQNISAIDGHPKVDYVRFRDLVQPYLTGTAYLAQGDFIWLAASHRNWDLDMALGIYDDQLSLMIFSSPVPLRYGRLF